MPRSSIVRSLLLLLVLAPLGTARAEYPAITVKNYAPFGLQAWVHYNGCDTKWFHVSAAVVKAGDVTPGHAEESLGNNACLITKITIEADKGTPAGMNIQSYYSSGTSYRSFYFLPASNTQDLGSFNTKDWQLFSEHEASVPDQGTTGMSPGFVITNKTQWPVAVSLDQVSCLYHDTVRPGLSFNRTTGAVWFTIKAQIVPDGTDPNNNTTCAMPVVEIVLSVFEAALTGGVVGWAALSSAAVTEAVGPVGALLIPSGMVQSAATAAGKQVLMSQLETIYNSLKPHQYTDKAGQYAGPPWPFRCAQKPTYEIRGGWGATGFKDGQFWIDPGSPLQIVKTNSCGNGMNNN